jgi:hypothetical protein
MSRPKIDGTVKRLNMYATEELMQRVDEWRSRQPGVPSASEAIRRLLEFGLDNPAAHHKARSKIKAA